MKLKTFNADNCPSPRNRKPAIGINAKSGLFNINNEAVRILELSPDDTVDIHQDEENEEDWYISKGNGTGFQLRRRGGGGETTNGLLFNNATLCRKIAESVNYQGESGKLLLGNEPVRINTKGKPAVELWPLITANLRNK